MKKFHTALTVCAAMAASAMPASAGDEMQSVLRDSLPERWELEQQVAMTSPDSDKWWHTLNDPILTALIHRAVQNNFNVAAAARRIEAAAQVEKQTRAGYYPSLSASLSWDRSQSAPTVHGGHGHPSVISYFNAGLSMSWEIDLFGRIAAQLKADKADYETTKAEYDAVLVSLASNIAKAYFQLRLAQAEVKVTERNVVSCEELLKLAQARYDVGLRPFLDVVQARMTLTQTRSQIPALEAQIRSSVNQIAILAGEYPDKLDSLFDAFPLPEVPPAVVDVTPVQLLRRRPDIVEAEKQLAAAAAQVGIAKKDFLPTLSLTASFGTQGQRFDELFGASSLYYSVVPTLSWTIFEGLARNARVAEAKANMLAQIDEYNLTVMTAVQEADNAIVTWKAASDQFIYQEMLLRDARRQLDLQIDRYRQGLNAFSDVQSAQVQVLQYENSLNEAHASRLSALATLYAALGGGWQDIQL